MEPILLRADRDGERADQFIARLVPELTRSAAQRLLEEGAVTLAGRPVKKNYKTAPGDVLAVALPEPEPVDAVPQDIPLDVVYEDGDVIVVNKPVGMVVHPAAGHPDGTLVNALLYHCGESLSGINGALRPGIVHRIDRDTSGQGLVGKVVLRRDDEAGGVPVDAVDNARPQLPVDSGECIAAVVEQGVDQGPVRVAGGGVDHHAHRFVHHDHIAVLVHHVQRDVLGEDVHRLRLREDHLNDLPGGGLFALFQGTASAGHRPLLQQPLGGGAGEPLHTAGQKGVQPLAPRLRGEDEGGHACSPWAAPESLGLPSSFS